MEPSPWVVRWGALIAPGASVLDVAAGGGRHTLWFAARGCRVTAVDRDAVSMQSLADRARVVVADLETGPWPLDDERFDAIVVTNYLWRPLFPRLLSALADGGLLLYETFAVGQETVGRPSRPDYLLARGELLDAVEGLRIVAFEDGFLADPERFVQRVAAVRESTAAVPARHALDARADRRGSVESSDSGTRE